MTITAVFFKKYKRFQFQKINLWTLSSLAFYMLMYSITVNNVTQFKVLEDIILSNVATMSNWERMKSAFYSGKGRKNNNKKKQAKGVESSCLRREMEKQRTIVFLVHLLACFSFLKLCYKVK